MSVRTETDFALLTSIQPLLAEQQAYIQRLEVERMADSDRIRTLEARIESVHRDYERELDAV